MSFRLQLFGKVLSGLILIAADISLAYRSWRMSRERTNAHVLVEAGIVDILAMLLRNRKGRAGRGLHRSNGSFMRHFQNQSRSLAVIFELKLPPLCISAETCIAVTATTAQLYPSFVLGFFLATTCCFSFMSENNYYAAAESKERPLDPDMVRMTAQATWEHAVDGAHILNRRYLRGKAVGVGQHGRVYLAFDLEDNDRQVVSGVSQFY
jgi:hypothetical protein